MTIAKPNTMLHVRLPLCSGYGGATTLDVTAQLSGAVTCELHTPGGHPPSSYYTFVLEAPAVEALRRHLNALADGLGTAPGAMLTRDELRHVPHRFRRDKAHAPVAGGPYRCEKCGEPEDAPQHGAPIVELIGTGGMLFARDEHGNAHQLIGREWVRLPHLPIVRDETEPAAP